MDIQSLLDRVKTSPIYQDFGTTYDSDDPLITVNIDHEMITEYVDPLSSLLCNWCFDIKARITRFKMDANIESIIIEYVDRGVEEWDSFGYNLRTKFPNLKILSLEQNYTYDARYRKLSSIDQDKYDAKNFMLFVELMKLNIFVLADSQSKFWKYIKMEDILSLQPVDSIYIINANYKYDFVNDSNNGIRLTTYFHDSENNKTLVYQYENCL